MLNKIQLTLASLILVPTETAGLVPRHPHICPSFLAVCPQLLEVVIGLKHVERVGSVHCVAA